MIYFPPMVLAGCLPWEGFPAIGYVGWGNSEIYWVGFGGKWD